MNFAESVKLTNTTNTTNLLPNSIYDLDAKKIIDFECNLSHKNILQTIIPHTICGTTFWEIDNFLQRDICDAVINKCEDVGFDSVDFRPIGRVICWDKSGGLVKTIEDSLNDWVKMINEPDCKGWEIPRGFGNNFVIWDKNTSKINQCLRINKNQSNQISIHRDAQYTQSKSVKSNYTLLIYLNENEIKSGGETEFIFPTISYEHNGNTIEQELELIGSNYVSYKITPKIGKAVIFPHFLLHKTTQLDGLKYVLRTDLICFGRSKEFYELPCALKLEDWIWCGESMSGDEEMQIYNRYMNAYGEINKEDYEEDEDEDEDIKNMTFDESEIINCPYSDETIDENLWKCYVRKRYVNFDYLAKIINESERFNNYRKKNQKYTYVNAEQLKNFTYIPKKEHISDYFDENINNFHEEFIKNESDDVILENYDGIIKPNKLSDNETYSPSNIKTYGKRILPNVYDIDRKKYYAHRDVICLEKKPKNELEDKIEKLAVRLFRQAQLNELEGKNSSELYEIVLDLRVEPRNITKYPEHLERLFYNNTTKFCKFNDKDDNKDEKKYDKKCDMIYLEARNANEYVYRYDKKFLTKTEIIKICVLFSTYTYIHKITDHKVSEQINLIKKLLNLNTEFNIIKELDEKKFQTHHEFGHYDRNGIVPKMMNELFDPTGYKDRENYYMTQTHILGKYKKQYTKYFEGIQKLDINMFKSLDDIMANPHPLNISCSLSNVNIKIPWNDCCMSDYNNCYYGCVKKDDLDLDLYCGISWSLNADDFLLELSDIDTSEKNPNIMSGKVCLITRNGSFNHASCQTFYNTDNTSIKFNYDKIDKISKYDSIRSLRQSWNISWEMNLKKNKVRIFLEPKVIM